MTIIPDNEVTRLEKRQSGLQRVATAINDLTIYGIYPTNFPKLVSALEHSKDHLKAEIQATKKRIIELGGQTVEEVFTDPLYNEIHDEWKRILYNVKAWCIELIVKYHIPELSFIQIEPGGRLPGSFKIVPD